jgi:C_GCAxxG_C_C family probable redox protein
VTHVEKAVECFKEGFHCSQAVFSAFAPDLGLDRERALKIGAGFGGGISRLGETCGAVTGAIMAIGLKYGRTRPDDDDAKSKVYEQVEEFVRRFRERRGAIACRDLLGHEIGTEEGRAKILEKDLFSTLCLELVRDAAEILEELLR